MTPINSIILYVADAPKSGALYGKILGAEPAESSPGWAAFYLPNGVMLGLWSKGEVMPTATSPGGAEIGIVVPSNDAVATTRDAWARLGLKIVQEPTMMDFGMTMTAEDPDGHRVRAFHPSQPGA